MSDKPTKEQQVLIDENDKLRKLRKELEELSKKRSDLLHEYDTTVIVMAEKLNELREVAKKMFPF